MKGIFRVVLVSLSLVVGICAQIPTPVQTPPPIDDVVRISTTLIQIDATVTDKKGRVISDIRPDEIEIYENGKKQKITNFQFVSSKPPVPKTESNDTGNLTVPVPPKRLRPEQINRTIALVVDDITLSFASQNPVRKALRDFVDNQMQEGDLVAIIKTSGGIGALQQFTSDKRQLHAAIDGVRWNLRGIGGISAFSNIEVEPLGEPELGDPDGRITNTENDVDEFREDSYIAGSLGAISYVIRGMGELPGRKSIMLLSDGFPIRRENSRGFTEATYLAEPLNRLIDQANRASVVIYTLDARGIETANFTAADNFGSRSGQEIRGLLRDRRRTLQDTQDGLRFLAKETGGIAIINRNDLGGGIEKILDDQSYYLIGYEPDDAVFDPEKRRFNKLEVKVSRDGAKVRYRSGFFGLSEEEKKPATREMSDTDRILNAVISPFSVNEINLSLNSVFRSDAGENLIVDSFLHIPIEGVQFEIDPEGNRKAAFDLLVMNFGENGVPLDQISKTFTINLKSEQFRTLFQQGIIYSFSFPIKEPGAYQMRVAIRDHATQKVGSANQFVAIPKLKKNRLNLSGLVVDNISYGQWNESQRGTSAANLTTEPRNDSTAAADTALRLFKNGSVLKYALEAYNVQTSPGKDPQLLVRTQIFKDGKLVYEGSDTAVEAAGNNGKIIPISGALNLAKSLGVGQYALQVVVTDKLAKKKRQIATQFMQFEIVE